MKKSCLKAAVALLMTSVFLSPAPAPAAERLVVEPAVKRIELSGYTRAGSSMTLKPEVGGRVMKVNYDEGETTKGEAEFLGIDPAFVEFDIKETRRAIEKLEVSIEQNDSRIEWLREDYERIRKLHEGHRATEVKLDDARQRLDQAELESRALKADKGRLEVTLERLRERLRRHSLRMPGGWTVTARMVEPGEQVQAGMPVGKAADFRTLVVPLAVSMTELRAIEALPRVFEVRLEGVPATATINWINPEFNERTRKLDIELRLLKHEGTHRGGMRLALPLEIESRGVMVPKAAVAERYENPRVAIKESGRVVELIVLDEAGDNLIVADTPLLKPGVELLPASGAIELERAAGKSPAER